MVPVTLVPVKVIGLEAVSNPPVAILNTPPLVIPPSSIFHDPLVVNELPFLTIKISPLIKSAGLGPLPSVLVPQVETLFALPDALE